MVFANAKFISQLEQSESRDKVVCKAHVLISASNTNDYHPSTLDLTPLVYLTRNILYQICGR